MSNARIVEGVWVRRVTWASGTTWRTDIFKSVLQDPRLKIAEFRLKNGPTVRVTKGELQRVLESGPDHYDGSIWGPFNIDPTARTLAGRVVEMNVCDKQRTALNQEPKK